jgi:acyl dehydratase
MVGGVSYLTPEVQALIGTELTGEPDQIQSNDLRFFAEAIRLGEAPKPLYSDEVYARETRYGGMIAPPTYFTRLARSGGYPWPIPFPAAIQERPGANAGAVFELVEPVRAGDTLQARGRVAKIEERKGDGGTVLLFERDFAFTNQLGQYVGTLRRRNLKYLDCLPHSRPEDLDAEILQRAAEHDPASAIPPYSKRVTLMQQNQFAGANREFGLYHMDLEFARTLGLPGVLVIETLKMAFVANMLEDWLGEAGWIRKLTISCPVLDYVGDTLTSRGRVVSKTVHDGMASLECAFLIENQDGRIGTTGSASVVVPEGSSQGWPPEFNLR